MAFATPAELQFFIGADVPTDRAWMMLTLASGAIVATAGVPIAQIDDDEVTIDGNGAPSVLLPSWPVTDVTDVKVAGEALAADDYSWSRAGELRRTHGRWPARLRAIEVTYTHGYAEVPDEIKAVTLQVAARGISNPQALNTFGDGQVTSGYGGGGTGVQVLTLYRHEEDLVRLALR